MISHYSVKIKTSLSEVNGNRRERGEKFDVKKSQKVTGMASVKILDFGDIKLAAASSNAQIGLEKDFSVVKWKSNDLKNEI